MARMFQVDDRALLSVANVDIHLDSDTMPDKLYLTDKVVKKKHRDDFHVASFSF
jgi:hypothetical protein